MKSEFPGCDLVSYLPFSQHIFEQIIGRFYIHGSVARIINRNTNCAFFRKEFEWSNSRESIVYNCRSAASWPNDLALSVTFLPNSLVTYAVLYGCNDETAEEITRRLSKTDMTALHPMMLPTIFAEIERDRQVELVQKKLTKFTQRIIDIGVNSTIVDEKEGLSLPPLATSMIEEPSIMLWVEISHLRNGLEAFQRKIKYMKNHVEELEQTFFKADPDNNYSLGLGQQERRQDRQQLRVMGIRIKSRLQELIDEYSENIGDCTTIIDGMNLASQLEWNQIGRRDAELSLRDNKLMKSIAVLTMIFLPATFVATLFSMGIFEWTGDAGDTMIVSPYIWLYVVATVLITTATLGAWYWFFLRKGKTRHDDGLSKA
ncbi:hypothetical protein F4810DRAFT_670699 [Camillea tinctor]|nr:hypothetical protein F4810DRAFT_670699 [Camillea tinctor]